MDRELIEKYADSEIYLFYADYRDNFNDSEKLVNSCIRENDFSDMYEMTDESVMDAIHYMAEQEMESIVEKMRDDGINPDDIDEDEILDYLKENDTSDPFSQIAKNTDDMVFFYSLGEEFVEPWDADDTLESINRIKRLFNISSDEYDDYIENFIHQAWNGELRVYFRCSFEEFTKDLDKFKTICFSGKVAIAIVNSLEGGGDHIFLEIKQENKVSFPFKKENLFVDKAVHYSYTYEVCGMYPSWCEDTVMELSEEDINKKIETSQTGAHMEREAEFQRVFDAGGCSAGDINFTRHRGVKYENGFPAGWRCPHCGQFWID